MKKLFVVATSPRFLLHYLYYKVAADGEVMRMDLARNISQFVLRRGADSYGDVRVTFLLFCQLLTSYRMVRNIFYARIAKRHALLARILALLAKPQPLLDVSNTADIGGGLIVQHGYATIIAPRKIGRDCWVNQGVTIGYTNDTDCPTLGDNVTVYSGAKVLGDVHVGNNVVIAANAVVVKDVEDNCVVGGVPAKVIKRL